MSGLHCEYWGYTTAWFTWYFSASDLVIAQWLHHLSRLGLSHQCLRRWWARRAWHFHENLLGSQCVWYLLQNEYTTYAKNCQLFVAYISNYISLYFIPISHQPAKEAKSRAPLHSVSMDCAGGERSIDFPCELRTWCFNDDWTRKFRNTNTNKNVWEVDELQFNTSSIPAKLTRLGLGVPDHWYLWVHIEIQPC